jgi:hypothetical protein
MPNIAFGKKALKEFIEDPVWAEKLENCKSMDEIKAVLEEFAKSKGLKKLDAPTK